MVDNSLPSLSNAIVQAGIGGAGGAAGQLTADIIKNCFVNPIIQQIDHLIHEDRNKQFLQTKAERMMNLFQDISEEIENQQVVTIPKTISYGLVKMSGAIAEARSLIVAQSQQQEMSVLHWLNSKVKIPGQIADLNAKIDTIFEEIKRDFETFAAAKATLQSAPLPQSFASEPPQETGDLLLPMPKDFEEGANELAKTELKTWITAKDLQVRMIRVSGMPGVGKTTLLKWVHNYCKKSKIFDVVIWVIVSRNYEILDLQGKIAEAIGLDLSKTFNIATRMMKLSADLKEKNFLLILDDLWSPIKLEEELGVAFGADKFSKVVFSTRDSKLASTQVDKSTEVKRLSKEQGRELFERVAFRGSHAPENLKNCCREIADECARLPLAITIVAAVMSDKTALHDWTISLTMMKNTDPAFPNTHPLVEKGLYKVLKWSYDDLAQTKNLQNCFLYCSMYPEDEQIWVDELVRMWIAEGFCNGYDESSSMHIGYEYVKLLIDRGLFETVNFERRGIDRSVNKPVNVWKKRFIRVHDVIRDLAIYIGRQEKNYLCRAGEKLKVFHSCETQGYKRMSLRRTQIEDVPEDFLFTQLVSLILSENSLACNVGGSFLKNLTSLKVLDLSNTQIESVPTSLTRLEFLSLRSTCIREEIGNLSNENSLACNVGGSFLKNLTSLRVLDLSNTQIESVPTSLTRLEFLILRSTCIKELPREIGNLSNLQFLDISECKYLTSLPTEISKLTSLKRLHLSMGLDNALTDSKSVVALGGLKHLIELHLYMFFKFENHEIMGTIMGSWVEMRHLYLHYNHMKPLKCNLPEEMQKMKNLQSLVLYDYRGTRLPNCICKFQQLERLELYSWHNVKELPPLELPPLEGFPNLKFLKLSKHANVKDLRIGSSELQNCFPKLEILHLSDLPKLRKIGTFEGGTLPQLHLLKIKKCPLLKKALKEVDKLPGLYGDISWWGNIKWY